jgi:hypothetical protein
MVRAMSAAATPAGPGGAEVHELVAPLGERLDRRGQAGHAYAQACVEGDLDLGHRGQAPVDVRVCSDHLHLEAGHPPLADLVERVGDAVHTAEAVGHERDAPRPAIAPDELALLAPEERDRGRVWNGGHAGGEDARGERDEAVGKRRGRAHDRFDRLPQPSLVPPPRLAEQGGMAEAVVLQPGEQLAPRHS